MDELIFYHYLCCFARICLSRRRKLGEDTGGFVCECIGGLGSGVMDDTTA